MDNTQKKQELKELLKIHFGYGVFRPGQERAIDNILSGKNSVVVLPTGGGKSLIYQLPALVLPGLTIVVSPLIALMKDQVDSLERVGIPATFINSSLAVSESNRRLTALSEGRYKIIYVAPERFYNKNFLDYLQGLKISLFAIDEAHCISQWGHDFRPSYLQIHRVIKTLGSPTIVALTATATPEVREDIIKQLQLKEPEMIVTGFKRPNLQLAVIPAASGQKIEHISDFLSTNPDLGSGIVYTGTRAKADEMLAVLTENGFKAVVYHAGLDAASRDWVQEQFMSGAAQVVVATNAFGLGVNKPDIRFVIHHDLPGTIEAYYQEAGRAGRDGQASFCLLFYNQQDRYLREFFIKGDNPPPQIISEIYDFLLSQANQDSSSSASVVVTYADISASLSESVPEMAIGTALKILEREGLISRPQDKSANSYLRLLEDWDKILDGFSSRAKVQKEIVLKLQEKYGQRLATGLEFSSEELAVTLRVKRDSLLRAFKKMADNGVAEYRPPKRGTEIKILQVLDTQDLPIDFSALALKAARAYEKLDEMENYVYTGSCRQQYILKYFGELNASICGRCDNCLRVNLSPAGRDKSHKKQYLSDF